MQEIRTIVDLINELKKCNSKKEYTQVVRYVNLDDNELRPYAHFSTSKYTRNCIERTEDFELILLCWEVGQDTPIHCHGDQECWVKLKAGDMREDRFDFIENKLVQKGDSILMKKGEISFMNDDLGYHSITNISNEKAMSLHLYAKPIVKCTIYDNDSNAFVSRVLKDFSFKGELL